MPERETGHLRLLGETTLFYGIYPLLSGLPLAVLGTSAALVVVKAVQAVIVSLTAAVVYVWAQTLWAIARGIESATLG